MIFMVDEDNVQINYSHIGCNEYLEQVKSYSSVNMPGYSLEGVYSGILHRQQQHSSTNNTTL